MASTNLSKITDDLMKKNNPLMQRAQTTGLQVANRRGFLNSSIAAGASQAAALDAVVPLASQQAQINTTQNQFDKRLAFDNKQADRGYSLDKTRLKADDRKLGADMFTTYQSQYDLAVARIMDNKDLSSKQRKSQIKAAKANMNRRVEAIQNFSHIDIDW